MYLRLLILFCFQQMAGYAQTHGIDSMRNRLPILNGKAKVDCLNKISEQFSFKWIHADSALRYSHLAFQQASSINYQRGLAEALILEADINGRLLGQPQQMVLISRRAIEIAKATSDTIWGRENRRDEMVAAGLDRATDPNPVLLGYHVFRKVLEYPGAILGGWSSNELYVLHL